MKHNFTQLNTAILMLTVCLINASCRTGSPAEVRDGQADLERIKYNNPDAIVELGVGLCSLPMPVDYNHDGLTDLVVTAGQDVPDGHTYFFENTGKKSGGIEVFKPAVRIGPKHEYFTPSYVAGELRVLGFNREYNLRNLEESREIYPERNIHASTGRIRANQWSYVDYDGNGIQDLIVGVGDWQDYGWDDAFNARGEWTAGPLHGYVYLIRNVGTDSIPHYEAPEMIRLANGEVIDVYGRPSPNFADFNGDGTLDIITGEFVDKLTFFKNSGTRTHPKYEAGKNLVFNGMPIRLKGCMIRPVAFDWDEDGFIDLVVGAEEGSVALIRNTGKRDAAGMPLFEAPRYFRQMADDVKAGVLITPVGVDWNGDGREDIIAGNAAGNINYFENLGGDPPVWAMPVKLKADGAEIRVMAGYNGSIQGPAEEKWGYTVVSVADWSNDGLPDIIMNSILGKIMWFENIGTKTAPKLAAPRPIEVEWEGPTPKPAWNWWDPSGKELVTQWRSTAQAIDLNGDGLTDLVGLDHEGFLVFFERRKAEQGLTLSAPRRIFFVEPDSTNAYDDRHRPVSFPDADGRNALAGYSEDGTLGYFGREWQGDRWGPYGITHRVAPPRMPDDPEGRQDGLLPLRMNAGWAGRSGRRKFVLADWTGDGRPDLLVNSYNVNLMENISDTPGVFVFRNRGRLAGRQLSGHTSCPTVVHWNIDGVPDLLVGAEDGHLYFLENTNRFDRGVK